MRQDEGGRARERRVAVDEHVAAGREGRVHLLRDQREVGLRVAGAPQLEQNGRVGAAALHVGLPRVK
eukprot:5267938-Prymnesium_polylepis.1